MSVDAARRRRSDAGLVARLVAVDAVALAVGWVAGWVVAATATSGSAPNPAVQVDDIAVGVVVSIAGFTALGVYRAPSVGRRSTEIATVAQAIAIAAVAVTGWQAVFGHASPGLAVGAAGGGLLAVVTAHYCLEVWLIGCRRQGRYLAPVVVAGTPQDSAALIDFLALNPEAGFRAAAVVGGGRGAHGSGSSELPVPRLGGYDAVGAAVGQTRASGVLVAVNHIPPDSLHGLLKDVSEIGLPVHLSSGLTGFAHSRLRTMPVAHEPFVVLQPLRHSAVQRAVKRTIDLGIAAATLAITAPVIAVCAVLIKLEDGGPVLFCQERIGRGGTPFRCIKLRTMTVDAEKHLAELSDRNERTGPLFKVRDDPRVTRVGRFMRAAAIDELPQLVNVLRGDMSVVGPRPALPAEAASFDAEMQTRDAVRPGLTGLWQTEANHKSSFEEYRRLDLFYVTNWSIALDLSILVNTAPTITRRVLEVLRRSAPTADAAHGPPSPASSSGSDRVATGPVPFVHGRRRSAVRPASTAVRAGRGRGRPPHVLIIVQNLPVPLDRRVWLESTALSAAGWDVSVICPRGAMDGVPDPAFEELEGVRIHRYSPPRPAAGTLGYAWEFAYCWLRTAGLSVRIFRRQRFDVIQGCNPPDTYFALARLFRPLGVRYVFDHHDLCPELYASRDPSSPPSRRLVTGLRLLERATFATADHVITTNESYRDTAHRRTGKPLDAFTIVRSAPDPAAMVRQKAEPELRHGCRHLCCYLGIMGHQDGVETVVRAARVIVDELGRDDVHFALLGFGDTLAHLQQLTTDLGLDDHVTFTGRVGPAEIARYLSTASVGLCPDPRTPFNDRSTMNKVLEYMAYELPVVSFDLAETLRTAGSATHHVTWVGDPEVDAKEFALAIIEVLDGPEWSSAMGRLGRVRIENGLGWPAQAVQYVDAYDRLLWRMAPLEGHGRSPVHALPQHRSRDLQGV